MSMIKIIPVYFQLQTFFHTYDTQRTVYLRYEKSGPSQHWKYLQTGFPVQYIDWSTRVDTILNSLMFWYSYVMCFCYQFNHVLTSTYTQILLQV